MLGAEMRASLECCQRVESRDNSSRVGVGSKVDQPGRAPWAGYWRSLDMLPVGALAAGRGGGEVSWEDRIDRVDLSQQAMLSWEGRPDRTSATHNRSGSGPSGVSAADGEAIKRETCEVRGRDGAALSCGQWIGCAGVERARLHPSSTSLQASESESSFKVPEGSGQNPRRRGPASGWEWREEKK